MDTKICKLCLILKPIGSFRKERNACKKCTSRQRQQRRKETGYYRTPERKLCQKQNLQRWRRNHPAAEMLQRLRNRAKASNIPFNLTKEDISIPEFCPVLGMKMSPHVDGPSPTSPSVDRVIPALGYVKGNVNVISLRANRLKSNASIEDLEKVLAYIRKSLSLMPLPQNNNN